MEATVHRSILQDVNVPQLVGDEGGGGGGGGQGSDMGPFWTGCVHTVFFLKTFQRYSVFQNHIVRRIPLP